MYQENEFGQVSSSLHLFIYEMNCVNYWLNFGKWNRMVIDIDLCQLVACVFTQSSQLCKLSISYITFIGLFKSGKSS